MLHLVSKKDSLVAFVVFPYLHVVDVVGQLQNAFRALRVLGPTSKNRTASRQM